MLYLSLRDQKTDGAWVFDHTEVLFSNTRICHTLVGPMFKLQRVDEIRGVSVYLLSAQIYVAPELGNGTSFEDALNDCRTIVSYALDIELHQDLERCHTLVAGQNPHCPNHLISARFDSKSEIRDEALIENVSNEIKQFLTGPEQHILATLRAMSTYERAMLAIERGQLDLGYALLVFVLESLAQAQPKPEKAEWSDFPGPQRQKLDRIFRSERAAPDVAQEIRDVLQSTEHLKVSKRFRDFVTNAIPADFFLASRVQAKVRIRRSQLPSLLTRAYDWRSSYAHALAPVAEVIRGHADQEVCSLRDHTLVLTLRGLHRIVRETVASFLKNQSLPLSQIDPPDLPGISYAVLSPDYWIYTQLPLKNGSDTRFWITTILDYHVWTCVNRTNSPSKPLPLTKIGLHAQELVRMADKPSRPALHALAHLCGQAMRNPPQRIETLLSHVVQEGACWSNVEKSAEALESFLAERPADFQPPILVEIAAMVAVATAYLNGGDEVGYRKWMEIARDDAASIQNLQMRLAGLVEHPAPLSPREILFPQGESQILEGHRE